METIDAKKFVRLLNQIFATYHVVRPQFSIGYVVHQTSLGVMEQGDTIIDDIVGWV